MRILLLQPNKSYWGGDLRKEIVYPFYVTRDGRIWNNNTQRYLKQQINSKGYSVVRVNVDGVKQTFRVHREVAKAFIPNIDNKPQVNHKDGNKQNNNVFNLEWCTQQENVDHAMKNGLWKKNLEVARISNEKRKKKIIAINLKTEEELKFDSIADAERYFNSRHICDVLKGKRNMAKGYTFKYEGGGDTKWI